MRSVQVFPSIESGALAVLLDGMGERREDEWFGIEAGTVEVSLINHGSFEELVRAMIGEGAWSARDIAAMRAIGGEIAGYQVEVRSSGGVDGGAPC